jgi:4-hydroxy-4-methyl-2-oxoglutarate aldolase
MDQIVEAFKKISIPAVSDAMDKLGIHGTCLGISPLDYGYHMVGRAYTVKYLPITHLGGTVGDYIDDVQAGQVVVLDNGGMPDGTVWGDILTAVAHNKGIAGTVIHGVCRDVDRSLEVKYPMFTRGKFMRTGKDRVDAVAVQVPISLGTVQVRPNDIVYGSNDGVLVIPHEKEEEILAVAQSIEETEEKIRMEVMKGTPLREAREKFNYHKLQTREK